MIEVENRKRLLKTIENIKSYCTNINEVCKDVGYDITTEKGAFKFLNNKIGPESFCPDDSYRFVKIKGKYIAIDEPIADLILRLNNNGMKTMYCCCGHQRKYKSKKQKEKYSPIQFYISFEFGEKEFDLMASVYEKLTGKKCFKYRNRAESVSCTVSDEFKKFIESVYIAKRNTEEYSGSTAWNQSLDIHYYLSKREEALALINNIINTSITEVNEDFNNRSVCCNGCFGRISNNILIYLKKIKAFIYSINKGKR